MELLAPAGSGQSLIAAVQNGADAVYLGSGSFSARRFADNFSCAELENALDYCHERGVKAYITINTLIFDREIRGAVELAAQVYRLGADAVLIQDLALASILKKELPGLVLHASTQMGIHDPGGLEYCERAGISRAVLARETSLAAMRAMSESSPVELEAFAHGALCMSFSGSCLYSSMSGERSGNRGTCAQPCRKRAGLGAPPGAFDYCLSPNDICMLRHLSALQSAGICCVKLEGRMKKPEYVAAVTRLYRFALDGADMREIARLERNVFELFNRGDPNTAHLFCDSVKTGRIASSKPSPGIISETRRSMAGENRRRPVSASLLLSPGRKAQLELSCGAHSYTAHGSAVEQANRPQDPALYRARLEKLGDTPFYLDKCNIEADESCFISAADLNALRRDAADGLKRGFHIRRSTAPIELKAPAAYCGPNMPDVPIRAGKKPALYVKVSTAEAAGLALELGADMVALEPREPERAPADFSYLARQRRPEQSLLLALPNVLTSRLRIESMVRIIESGFADGAEANNTGQLSLIRELPIRIAGIGLNAANGYAFSALLDAGFNLVIPSLELTGAQNDDIIKRFGQVCALNLHGRAPLMQLLHCPVKERYGCRRCAGDAGTIADEAGRRFPLSNIHWSDGCLVRMFNCHVTDVADLAGEIHVPRVYAASFIAEDNIMLRQRLSAIRAAADGHTVPKLDGATRGHWNRKVD